MDRVELLKKLKKTFNLKQVLKEEDTKFKTITALKIVGVSFFVFLMISYILFIFLSFNHIFFQANGFLIDQNLSQAFYDFILMNSVNKIHWVLIYFVCLFWFGVYISLTLLRPFRDIGSYCEKVLEEPSLGYNPDSFSDMRILTRFSEFFFQYLLDRRKEKLLRINSIPPQFQKIHKPVFDNMFFFHFSLLIIIIAIGSGFFITVTANEVYEGTINLALKSLKVDNNSIRYFLQNQKYLFDDLLGITLVTVFISYFALAFHLYSKVSGPAFGFFTTMRAFMKGSYHSRVHLLGFNHIRPYSRKFNKYLDYIVRELPTEVEKASK